MNQQQTWMMERGPRNGLGLGAVCPIFNRFLPLFGTRGRGWKKSHGPWKWGQICLDPLLGGAGRSQPRDDHVKQEYNPHNLVIPAPTLLVGHSKVNLNKLDTGEKELYRKLYRN